MYAEFNDTNFPTIYVKFLNNNINEENYQDFINKWNLNDSKKIKYNYFFDLSLGLGNPNIYYAYKLANFLKQKKKDNIKYLQYSIIYTKSNIDLTFLKIIFSITKPIARVYIIKSNDENYLRYLYHQINHKKNKIIDVNIYLP